MEGLLIPALVLVQLLWWLLVAVGALYALRALYRFITAPPGSRTPGAPPQAAPDQPPSTVVTTSSQLPLGAVSALAAQPERGVMAAPQPKPVDAADAQKGPEPSPASVAPTWLQRYPDYARWGAGAAFVSAGLDVVQTCANIFLGDDRGDAAAAGVAVAVVLVIVLPELWLAWSYLKRPRTWKMGIILALILLGVAGDVLDIVGEQDRIAMMDLLVSIFVLWYAIQSLRGVRAAHARAQGREVAPVSNPASMFTWGSYRAVWGGVLLLAFVGVAVLGHGRRQNAEQAPAADGGSTETNETATQPAAATASIPPPTSAESATSADSTASAPQPPKALVDAWGENDEDCRGATNPDAPETKAACTARDTAYAQLNKLGWCYGTKAQSDAEYQWRRCAPGSIGYHAAE